jgi:hypothetical protein
VRKSVSGGKDTSHRKVLEFMKVAPVGETTLKALQETLDLSNKTVKNLRQVLNDHAHPLTKALVEIGVSYSVIGSGRAARTSIVKRPAAGHLAPPPDTLRNLSAP